MRARSHVPQGRADRDIMQVVLTRHAPRTMRVARELRRARRKADSIRRTKFKQTIRTSEQHTLHALYLCSVSEQSSNAKLL